MRISKLARRANCLGGVAAQFVLGNAPDQRDVHGAGAPGRCVVRIASGRPSRPQPQRRRQGRDLPAAQRLRGRHDQSKAVTAVSSANAEPWRPGSPSPGPATGDPTGAIPNERVTAAVYQRPGMLELDRVIEYVVALAECC
jgi:hypothetical protein